MTPHKERAANIIQRRFHNFNEHEQNQLRKLKKAKLWEEIFPWLSMEHQFQVLVCEVYDTIENHKNRLTDFGKAVFEVGELADLYQKYYKGLFDYERFPFQWFGGAPCLHDCVEIARLVCSMEIRRLNSSLACLRQDLEILLKAGHSFANMRYCIDLLGANVRFEGLTEEAIKQATAHPHLNVIVLPFEGRYKNFLANYMLDNQLVTQKRAKEGEANGKLFAENLSSSLTHYKASRSLFKSVRFEAELQASAGKLLIRFKPYYLPSLNAEYFTSMLLMGVSILPLVNIWSRSINFYAALAIGASVWLVGVTVGWKKRIRQDKREAITAQEADFLKAEIEPEPKRTTVFDEIFAKLHQDISVPPTFTGFFESEKKYANPTDALRLYLKRLQAIRELDLSHLRDFRLDMPQNECFDAVLYVLYARMKRSLTHFLMLMRPVLAGKIETTIYVKFLDINVSTHGFYGGIWGRAKSVVPRALLASEQTDWARPDVLNEALAAWVGEQESLLESTQLAYDLQRITKQAETYRTSGASGIPLMLDLEEIAIYF